MKAVVLRLSDPLRARIERWAVEARPAEACGLLIGRELGDEIEVVEVCAARNLARERATDRYELDPADHLAAHERARELGLDVVGVWHSHPERDARPSELDRANAWSGWSYVIVGVDSRGERELRSWRLSDERFTEERVLP